MPDPAPPFHHTSLPALPEPAVKLQTVRLSTWTLAAFHTRIPLRPSPPSEFWSPGAELHGVGAEALVPSTIVELRSIPRRVMFGVEMSTPPYQPLETSDGDGALGPMSPASW